MMTNTEYLRSLAKEYFDRCEAYDRTVCTGRILDDSIMPACQAEFLKVNAHAVKVMREIRTREGLDAGELYRAIQHYHI